ncbi:RidA family protein [Paludisphaera borealis]|uniref:2-iminobutanoate/2-iminopropanoate deaminase n=1 Tax=Paludisphaera borealis TaxID=1387353 RepID=A0A1U7CJ81_9BACT|nr:RidA family protein [Paludisphaera borealis]APW58995.1 2-iminobutanoate/2-iminopropanoate deaminase [Paludisphaera borealis]
MTPKVKITTSERNERLCASSGSAWEATIGYSRAIRVKDAIFVTGTVGVEADGHYSPTLEGQTRRAFEIIFAALEALDGKAADVVRTRIFVTDIKKWKEVGAVHGELFGEIRPALTMVQVSGLIDADAQIEIEVDALIHDDLVNRMA